MLHKTKGVVFRFTRYGETSVIVTIFTSQFGLQSYIVNGARSKKASGKMAMFQPLTLLELVVYHRENANINRIREIRCFHQYHSIHNNVIKTSVAMFITEVINKTIKEESHASDLCEFLISSLIALDTMDNNIENFHLVFLVRLSGFLGFAPQTIADIVGFRMTTPLVEPIIRDLLRADYSTRLAISIEHRREILDLLIRFFQEHSGLTGDIKSLQILREVLT